MQLSCKDLSPQTTARSTGGRQRKSKHQVPWCLALAKCPCSKLGCCISRLFLETSESNVRQDQRQVQGCAWPPWYLALAKRDLRKLAATYEGKSQCAVPVSCRTPDSREAVVALNKRYCRQWGWCILATVRDTFAKQTVSVSQTNFRAGSQHKWTVFAIETRYQDLQMDHHIYMFICRDIFRYIDSDKSWINAYKEEGLPMQDQPRR